MGVVVNGSARVVVNGEQPSGGGIDLSGVTAGAENIENGYTAGTASGIVEGTLEVISPPMDNMILWLDASDLTLENGSAISQWNDKSGNENHAVQSTEAHRPTYVSSGIGGVKPSVAFNGSSQFFNLSDLGALNGLSQIDFFIVYKLSNGFSSDLTTLFYSSADGMRLRFQNRVFYTETSVVTTHCSLAPETSTGFVTTAYETWANIGGEADTEFALRVGMDFSELSGSLILSNSGGSISKELDTQTSITPGTMSLSDSLYACVGARNLGTPDRYFNGQISEILLYSTLQSETNANSIIGYFIGKYGLRINVIGT